MNFHGPSGCDIHLLIYGLFLVDNCRPIIEIEFFFLTTCMTIGIFLRFIFMAYGAFFLFRLRKSCGYFTIRNAGD